MKLRRTGVALATPSLLFAACALFGRVCLGQAAPVEEFDLAGDPHGVQPVVHATHGTVNLNEVLESLRLAEERIAELESKSDQNEKEKATE